MTIVSQLLFFDSKNSTYLDNPNNTCGVSKTPLYSIFGMNQQFRKIHKVHLKSLEMPCYFSNIRKGATDTFKFIINGVTTTIVLSEKNYSDIQVLLVDLNVAIKSAIGDEFGMTINTVPLNYAAPYRLYINFGNSSPTTFSVIDTRFSLYILGFRGEKDVFVNNDGYSSSFFTANNAYYNLNPDSYLLMNIPQLNNVSASMNGIAATFKIPMQNTITNSFLSYK